MTLHAIFTLSGEGNDENKKQTNGGNYDNWDNKAKRRIAEGPDESPPRSDQ
jgi:hypothetical protein